MTRGLVIGKFMPLHNGHIALINFAATKCDELIVSMSYRMNDPIDATLRFAWIQETFQNQHNIKTEISLDDFDDEHLRLEHRMERWRTFIERRFPKIDVLISSEAYGEPFARALAVPHILFDLKRVAFPVSATRIRSNPFAYWEFIPPVVRPFFVKKICFYGPESTGKSSMARRLADRFQTESVPEVSREILTSNEFSRDDIIRIGREQTLRVMEKTRIANKLLFCDTDVITTEIYSAFYLHEIPSELFALEKQIHYDQYFLFQPDVPWVADGIRDLGHRRQEMYAIFKKELDSRKIPYSTVSGSWEERERHIVETIQTLFFSVS
jgi:HTH-type transcriptional repressor of NAD biosynthesis genes